MMPMTPRLIGLVLVLATTSCFPASQETLRTRAAFDFQCDKNALTLTELESGAAQNGQGAGFGVEGCGRRGTYATPDGSTWLLDAAANRVVSQ
jgi:hypothetical protein